MNSTTPTHMMHDDEYGCCGQSKSVATPSHVERNNDDVTYLSDWKQFQLLFRRLNCAVETEPVCSRHEMDVAHLLSSSEKAQLGDIRSAARRHSRLSGSLAAKRAARRLQPNTLEKQLSILRTPDGKPEFDQFPHLHLSISHANDIALACVSHRPCGVDLEYMERRPSSLERYFFSPKEREWIHNGSRHPNVNLHILWTRKEAISKLLGKGAQIPFKSILALTTDNHFSLHSFVMERYAVSLSFFKETEADK
ncbi:MAG: 4'-phosphopantetheinyl transferase superfamily protein [Deltaproteobacteria bacterium]|nr:4'-phosphopantetheinyl transferase superfamily protein [Deltaproteobacteria bacterium]